MLKFRWIRGIDDRVCCLRVTVPWWRSSRGSFGFAAGYDFDMAQRW
jgi:hypothetical protein